MPKMKTHSGSKKRFKVTATGKVRGRSAFSSHILEKKSPKRKRRLGTPAVISKHDKKQVMTLLGAKKGRRGRPGQAGPEASRRTP
jgi:large subunit ribosomal protein L35